MQVEIKIDKDCKEAKCIIITDKMTDELDAIVRQLSSCLLYTSDAADD